MCSTLTLYTDEAKHYAKICTVVGLSATTASLSYLSNHSCHCHEGIVLSHVLLWHRIDLGFPSRTLQKVSNFLSGLAVSQNASWCPHWFNIAHPLNSLWCKRKWDFWTRGPFSIAPKTNSDTSVSVVCSFDEVQRLTCTIG